MGTWHRYTLSDRPGSYERPACYAVYMDGKLVYVGQTAGIRVRLFSQHKFTHQTGFGYMTPWGRCSTLAFKVKYPRRYGEWLALEARLIRRLRPIYNRRGRPNA